MRRLGDRWHEIGWAEALDETDVVYLIEEDEAVAHRLYTRGHNVVQATVTGSLAAGEDAIATAFVEVVDDLGFVSLLFDASDDLLFGPGGSGPGSGTVTFQLDSGEVNFIGGVIDTDGTASAAAVPTPAPLALLGVGLVALAARRRK